MVEAYESPNGVIASTSCLFMSKKLQIRFMTVVADKQNLVNIRQNIYMLCAASEGLDRCLTILLTL